MSDIPHLVTEERFVDKWMRGNVREALRFCFARGHPFYSFCRRRARHRNDEVRLWSKHFRLCKKILMSRVEHVEGPEDHNTHHFPSVTCNVYFRYAGPMHYTPSHYVKTRILPLFENKSYMDTEPSPEGLAAIDRYRDLFSGRKNSDHVFYTPKRISRYLLSKVHFPDAFIGKVADVGSRQEALKKMVDGEVVSIDKNNPALESFDWDKESLPFADRYFNAALCLDTLEHIMDIHKCFHDLLRVTNKTVVVSLPNGWRKSLKEFLRGYGSRVSYGIPPERPYDRHKWFMNTEDIEHFFYYNAERAGFKVEHMVYHAPVRVWWHYAFPLLKYVLPERYYKNFCITTVFGKFTRVR